MRVRLATMDDQEGIREAHERAVYELASDHYRDEVLDAWTDLEDGEDADDDGPDADDDGPDEERSAQPENGRLYVAEAEGDGAVGDGGDRNAVAGFGDVRFDPPEYLEEPADGGVRAVYVHPEFAGQGVGSTLLERLETTARDQGLDSLGLLSSVNARSFYEHHGYEAVAESTFQFGEDVEGPAIEMRKEL